jgi:hypothetical protein
MRLACVLFISLLLSLTAPLAAQTLLELDSPAATVSETTGPPAACGFPTGPGVAAFVYPAPFICPTAGPIPFVLPFIGDVATNRLTNTIWVTDGVMYTEYAGGGPGYGTPVRSFLMPPGFAVPGPVTGLDVLQAPFAPPGTLLVTDGAFCAGVMPPAAPGCALPVVVIPPFALGFVGVGGVATDLAWSPSAGGSIWFSTALGFVANVLIGGAPGPFGIFPVAPGPCFPAPPLTGIAIDTATPSVFGAPISMYVTNGPLTYRCIPGGGPAPPTFYRTAPCVPGVLAPLNGLGYSLHTIAYGVGTDPILLVPPVATGGGQSSTPSGPMSITLSSNAPGMAYLLYGLAPACPVIGFLGGNSLYIAPPLFGPVGPFPVGVAGLTLPFAIPAAAPVGASLYLQWIVAKTAGGFQATNGVELTIGLP